MIPGSGLIMHLRDSSFRWERRARQEFCGLSALALRSIVEYIWRHLNSESKADTFTGQKWHPGSQSPIWPVPSARDRRQDRYRF